MDSLPLSRAENSQPPGIGRVVSLDSGSAWNNLGRNVVFADRSLRPVAVFGDTIFPDDDEASQFDLDIHAIVELAGTEAIAVLNHYGMTRIFGSPWAREPGDLPVEPNLDERRRLEFVEDIERMVGLGDHLVTSQPRGRRLDGVLVTEPLDRRRDRIAVDPAHESFGFVSALTARSTSRGHRLGRPGRRGPGPVGGGRARAVSGRPTGSLRSTFWLPHSSDPGRPSGLRGVPLVSAGIDDYRWDELGGGGLAQFDLASGAVLTSARFGEDLAWGSGGVAVALVDGVPCGVGRCGEIHVLPPGAATTTRLTKELSERPLGIAHSAVVGDQLVIGFNRGGYRLDVMPLPSLRRLIRDLSLRRA